MKPDTWLLDFSDPSWATPAILARVERQAHAFDDTPCSDCGKLIRLGGTTVNATYTELQARYCDPCWKIRRAS